MQRLMPVGGGLGEVALVAQNQSAEQCQQGQANRESHHDAGEHQALNVVQPGQRPQCHLVVPFGREVHPFLDGVEDRLRLLGVDARDQRSVPIVHCVEHPAHRVHIARVLPQYLGGKPAVRGRRSCAPRRVCGPPPLWGRWRRRGHAMRASRHSGPGGSVRLGASR